MVGKIQKALEKLRTKTQHQPTNGPSRLPRTTTPKIVNRLLELADGKKLAGWCSEVAKNLEDYFEKGLSPPRVVTEQTGPLVGHIVVARGGYNCLMNHFAKIESDFPQEVILRPIGQLAVSGDGQSGTEVPCETARVNWTRDARLLATKSSSGGFWGNRMGFELWDGTPQPYHGD
jgi:hypothetical protein